ncbi:hypothetical protein FQA47_022953 [Oryzias melastigma]|uniref:Uncharacterized protein n=1 Tax=Oryzias melastigma TaxID=30732 RepID=A0A834FDV1_ORYME|nr:hypothetical protein FQA47_022953 [Oryzias melastigma]
MAGLCVAAECVLNYPLGRNAPGAVALHRLGVGALGMIFDVVVLRSDAGLFQEIDADTGLFPETRTASVQDPSLGQGEFLSSLKWVKCEMQ